MSYYYIWKEVSMPGIFFYRPLCFDLSSTSRFSSIDSSTYWTNKLEYHSYNYKQYTFDAVEVNILAITAAHEAMEGC